MEPCTCVPPVPAPGMIGLNQDLPLLPLKKAGVKQYPAVTIELERNTGQEIPGIITVVSFLNDVIYCC